MYYYIIRWFWIRKSHTQSHSDTSSLLHKLVLIVSAHTFTVQVYVSSILTPKGSKAGFYWDDSGKVGRIATLTSTLQNKHIILSTQILSYTQIIPYKMMW